MQQKKFRVGIPRSLLYYKFSHLWITFFKQLGAEVLISPSTTKQIKENAVRIAPDEDCYSTKLYFGHILTLRDKVDYLFIPRFGGCTKKLVGCPKFIGLAEVVRSTVPDLPEILMPHYNRGLDGDTRIGLILKAFHLGRLFTKNPIKRIRAIFQAFKSHKKYKNELILSEKAFYNWENNKENRQEEIIAVPKSLSGKNVSRKPIRIALVGHSYVLNDSFSSLNIRTLLETYGIEVITSEQMPRKLIKNQMAKLRHNLYFDYEREILGTIMYFLDRNTVDGIIQIIIFSCGPDSITSEIALRFSRRKSSIPLLQLVFDELTGEAGVKTRIEAFTDMLRRRIDQKIFTSTTQSHSCEMNLKYEQKRKRRENKNYGTILSLFG